jgi:hypothetical protein
VEEVFIGSNTGRYTTDTHIELDVDKYKGGILTGGAVYSPGRMRKKKAMLTMSAIASESALS